MMKKVLIFFGVIIAALALFYLATSFIELSFDITEWPEKARAMCVGTGSFVGLIFGPIVITLSDYYS